VESIRIDLLDFSALRHHLNVEARYGGFSIRKKNFIINLFPKQKKSTKNKSLWWSITNKVKTSIHTPSNLSLKYHPIFHLKNALVGIHQDGFVGLEEHIGIALDGDVGF
jgi:hypothetical protein